MREIRTFKRSSGGGVTPKNNIKKGDHVVLYGRGQPKGVIKKVDMSYHHGGKGSVWYDVQLSNGRVITRRAWDFKHVYRP